MLNIKTSGNIASIKSKGKKQAISGNIERLENLKKTATPKAKKVLSRMQREIRRDTFATSKKLDFEVCLNTWNLLTMSSEDLQNACYENFASVSNGKEFKNGNKNLRATNQEIKIKGIA